ncbi:MAG: hypothetical protein E7532_03660 [Ruminococcaceae bacterium]|nr:hypothetical protein [Oscillospiraceae bacterium]
MRYESFQQLIDTMDSVGYDYKKEILEIEKKKQAFLSESVGGLGLTEHIRTMVYAQLSNNRPWEPIVANIDKIDEIFGGFDLDFINNTEPHIFVEEIRKIRCGNRQIKRQMFCLRDNIKTLQRIALDHGSIDNYYHNENLGVVIKNLSDSSGKYKLKYLGVPLVCEYLKGLGIEVVKPDTLLCRILGRLGYSSKIPASHWEAIEICRQIGDEYHISQTMVDTVLWQYCAAGKFEVCVAKPKCELCKVTCCKYNKGGL